MLRKRLLVTYLLLIGAILVVNLVFALQVTSQAVTSESRVKGGQADARVSSSVAERTLVTQSARSDGRLMWICGGLVAIALGYILFLLITRVFRPLETIIKTAREISEGNLSVSVPLDKRDEIGALGQTVNDIAANYQEVLLYTGAKVGNLRSAVFEMEEALDRNEKNQTDVEVRRRLEVIRHELESLSGVVQQFTFYEARFNGYKVLRND